jgi:hypothetical protein
MPTSDDWGCSSEFTSWRMVMVAEGVNKTMLTHLYMITLKRSSVIWNLMWL